MATANDTIEEFPNIWFRIVEGRREPYVADSGLAVWEIAFLARAYNNDPDTLAHETFTDRGLIEEGLEYARTHRQQIDAQVKLHTERSLEDLQKLLPGLHVMDIPESVTKQQPT